MSNNLTSDLSKPMTRRVSLNVGAARGVPRSGRQPKVLLRAPCRLPSQDSQRGVALVVALILLIVITLVGLAAVRGTIMQQKMSGNFYDRQIAFQTTEAALRQGEAAVQAATAAAPAGFRDCSPTGGNHCLVDPFADANPSPAITVTTVSSTAYDSGNLVASQPQYVVEYMGNFLIPSPNVKQLSNCSGYAPCGSTHYADFYRITARSGDPKTAQNRASVTLQSTYKRS